MKLDIVMATNKQRRDKRERERVGRKRRWKKGETSRKEKANEMYNLERKVQHDIVILLSSQATTSTE